MSAQDVFRILGQKWKSLDEAGKRPYIERTDELNRLAREAFEKESNSKSSKQEIFLKTVNKKLRELRNYIEKNSEYVGDNFVSEARSIHYDKKNVRSIYGKATPEQTEELLEEGIEVNTVPWVNKVDN